MELKGNVNAIQNCDKQAKASQSKPKQNIPDSFPSTLTKLADGFGSKGNPTF